jgi:hypothetical protein
MIKQKQGHGVDRSTFVKTGVGVAAAAALTTAGHGPPAEAKQTGTGTLPTQSTVVGRGDE